MSLAMAPHMSLEHGNTMAPLGLHQTKIHAPKKISAVNWRVISSETQLDAPMGCQRLSQHLKGATSTRQSAIRANNDLKQQLLSWQISQNVQESMKSYTATDGGSNKQSK
jgi:hypothetical protein